MRRRKKKPDLLDELKAAILRVLADDQVTAAERIKAIELGAKLAAIERRWGDPDGDGKGFFDKRRD